MYNNYTLQFVYNYMYYYVYSKVNFQYKILNKCVKDHNVNYNKNTIHIYVKKMGIQLFNIRKLVNFCKIEYILHFMNLTLNTI